MRSDSGSLDMRKIASMAGVSTGEVALVMAGDPRVAPPIRDRVGDAIHAAEYEPLAAVQARLGRPLRIANVFKNYRGDDPEANRFYTPIAATISLACSKRDISVTQVTMAVDENYELLSVPRSLTDGEYDAAFFFGAQLEGPSLHAALAAGFPLVLVDGYSDNSVVDSVINDNVAGAKAVVDHLVAAGHRGIAIVGTEPVCYPSVQERRLGYSEAMASHGLPTHFIDISYVLTEAVAVTTIDYVERHPEVTAIFAANDLITVAILGAARAKVYRVPRDLSLVGFDDIDLASLVMPPLTTVAIDKPTLGRAAFALMAHRLEVPEAPPVKAVLTPRLVERESVAAPRRRQPPLPPRLRSTS